MLARDRTIVIPIDMAENIDHLQIKILIMY